MAWFELWVGCHYLQQFFHASSFFFFYNISFRLIIDKLIVAVLKNIHDVGNGNDLFVDALKEMWFFQLLCLFRYGFDPTPMISLMNKVSNNNGQCIERKTERYDLQVECKVVVYR